MIRWGNMFGPYFGMEMTTSAAVAILIEGVKRIEPYQEMPHFNDVKSVWNSLTNFALSELDNAPENVRRQMIELYIKKIDRLFKNGNGPRLRVNILSLPREFANLSDTVMRYSDRISSIIKINMKPVADLKTKYADSHRDDDDDDESIDRRLFETNDRIRDRQDRRDRDRDRNRNRDHNRDRRGDDEDSVPVGTMLDDLFTKSSHRKYDDDDDSSGSLLKGIKPEKLLDVDLDEDSDDSDDDKDEDPGTPPINDEELND